MEEKNLHEEQLLLNEFREFMEKLKSRVKTRKEAQEINYYLIDYKIEFEDLAADLYEPEEHERFIKELEVLKNSNNKEFHTQFEKILNEFPEYKEELDKFIFSLP